MRTLIFLLASLAVSCTAEPVKTTPINITSDCGTIVATGEDQRGDYIEVRMPNYNSSQKDRYQVPNYLDYQINQQICDFTGLVKQPL